MATNSSNNGQVNTEDLFKKILEGSKLAVSRLIERKKKENGYLIISQNGKVVKIKASDITLSK